MAVTINLVSEEESTIQSFLTDYFEKDMLADNLTTEWSYILNNPLDAINLISAVVDNNLSDTINTWISFDPNLFLRVTEENLEEMIKYILSRFSKVS